MKPQTIIDLEFLLDIQLNVVSKNLSRDLDIADTYALDNENLVIGLNLEDNKISNIKFLENFPHLKSLNLSYNFIEDYTPLSYLGKLEKLTLRNNEISDLNFLEICSSIYTLDLSQNKIKNLSSLKYLEKLNHLNLWSNNISDISEVSHLLNLNHLTLWNNQITDISPIISLISLKYLDLEDNLIEDISAIFKLRNITTLYLSKNLIFNIKPIRSLSKIRTLTLNSNKLVDVSIVGSLKNLINLSLSYNSDITNYNFFINLKKLNFLNLAGNKLTDISFLKALNTLLFLNLSSNTITDISSLSHLISLNDLDLSENLISDITILTAFSELVSVKLQKNKIKDLRPLINIIQKGIPITTKSKGINVENNPLEYPPIETIDQGNTAVIRYFEKIDKEGEGNIFEAKLTLVGEGSAGKTTLLKRLIDSKSNLPEEKNRTRGISIDDWEFKIQKNKKHIAHIWDFGGQDVYYPVHRFFLTENSVFVLLASSRQNTHHFDYWIPTIYQFGGKSPIILGQTCHDGNTSHWNDIGVYIANENFNIIKDQAQNYHELNLPKNNKGLVQIKKSIVNQIINLPHYKKNVPKSWIPIRELINRLKQKNCIPYIELKERIIKSNPKSFSTREDVEDCIKFFHSIGVLLWYNNESQLRDWVILNPKWAVDAVYKIIDYKKNSNKGIILSSDFDIVWKAKIYDDKHTILKDMLEVFKIAFPKKNSKTDYIMPTRLQSMDSKNIWEDSDAYLHIEYQYEFMPKGLVNQISAELSRYIIDDEQVWNNGVNFCDGDTTSQVFEDFYNRKIIVKAKGKDARDIMKIIMNAIQDITDGYKGVIPKIIIPCACLKCFSKKESTTFSYEMLLGKIKENREAKVSCNISEIIFKVEDLLYNIGLPNPVKEIKEIENLERKNLVKTIKIFLASSSELVEERKDFRQFISVENDRLHKKGIYFEIVQWEYFLDEISTTKLQDDYNAALLKCDIALCLFFTKVGKFTEEEFNIAYSSFKSTGNPKIWTYFKNSSINTGEISLSINTLLKFKDKLRDLGHFQTNYSSTSDLQLQFKRQLELYLDY